jgi:AcrR family transcriptional regulator
MVRGGEREPRSYHHGNLRQALIDAGVALARTGGPNAVLLRAASREAGVSHNAAYRHFANQEDLLAAVAGQCMTRLSLLMIERMRHVGARDPVGRAAGRLEAIGRAYIEFARTEPGWFRTAFSSARSHPSTEQATEPVSAEPADGTGDTDAVPNPYDVLRAALDEPV